MEEALGLSRGIEGYFPCAAILLQLGTNCRGCRMQSRLPSHARYSGVTSNQLVSERPVRENHRVR
jgi:hypothetical protein